MWGGRRLCAGSDTIRWYVMLVLERMCRWGGVAGDVCCAVLCCAVLWCGMV
ncbi:hypothetical protein P171DRAFT_518566 [Karstenula rhodostoma CBS 690.94]|uniref:Uncharacterized protein n=1 Tax=Karstenula rhodostoma CBS 690.94 TaxID=1392251 RepID=A0A9P4PNY1_9PLEO|nr:hypothetical protein P171DRAFT_518566 [Karstenula rhodostoma CBS 690.94]